MESGPDSTDLWVRVVPGAQRDGLAGVHDGQLRVRIAAPPRDGAANARLIRFLARQILGVSKSRVEIVNGQTGRTKRVRIHGQSEQIRAALAVALGDDPQQV
jgi:uncharacterized protein (TIGR00251 family)